MRTISNPAGFRDGMRKRFKSILFTCNDTSSVSESTMETMSINLERGIYNYILQKADKEQVIKKWSNPFFVEMYTDHARSIYVNLCSDSESNTLRKQVVSKKIKAQDLAFMTHQEMMPEKWTALLEQKRIRDKNKYEVHLEASTDNFLCYKCKSRECTYYQMQTRSADEPMTTFVTCIKCGNRWKC